MLHIASETNPLAKEALPPFKSTALFSLPKKNQRSWANRGIAFIAHPIFVVLASIQLVKALMKSVCIVFFDANSVAIEWRVTAKLVEKVAQSFLCTFTGKALFQTTENKPNDSFAVATFGATSDTLLPEDNWEGIGDSLASIVHLGPFYERIEKIQYTATYTKRAELHSKIARKLFQKLCQETDQRMLLHKFEEEIHSLRKHHSDPSIQNILHFFWDKFVSSEAQPNPLQTLRTEKLSKAKQEVTSLLTNPINFFHSLREITKKYSLFLFNLTDEEKKNYIVLFLEQELIKSTEPTINTFCQSLRILLQKFSLPTHDPLKEEIIEKFLEKWKVNQVEKLRKIAEPLAMDLVIKKCITQLPFILRTSSLYDRTNQMRAFIQEACQNMQSLYGISISPDKVLFSNPKLLVAFLPELLLQRQELILAQVGSPFSHNPPPLAMTEGQEAPTGFAGGIPASYSIQEEEISQELSEKNALESFLKGNTTQWKDIQATLAKAETLEEFLKYLHSITKDRNLTSSQLFWYCTSQPALALNHQQKIEQFQREMLHWGFTQLGPIMNKIAKNPQLTPRQKIEQQLEILCKFAFNRSKYYPTQYRRERFYIILENILNR